MGIIIPETARDINEYENYMIRLLERMYFISIEPNRVVVGRKRKGIPKQPKDYLEMVFSYNQSRYVIYKWMNKNGVRSRHSKR